MTTQTDAEREHYEAEWAALGVKAPPRAVDLPYSDGEPMETWIHWLQMTLLLLSLRNAWRDRHDYFAGGNMFLYYSLEQAKNRDVRGPDVFVAMGVSDHPRLSWVVWEENKAPDLIIELNSPSTRHIDHGIKKRIYQDQVRVPMYVLYDMDRDELEGYTLAAGVYQPVSLDEQGRLDCGVLGLKLVRWTGEFSGTTRRWLRWATPDGRLLTTSDEDAVAARMQTEAARMETEAARMETATARTENEALRGELRSVAAELDAERQRREEDQRRIRELEARLAAQDGGETPPA